MKGTLLRRQSLWITALFLVLLAVFALGTHSIRIADAEYKGRHFSEWMAMVRNDPVLSSHDPRSQEAIRILREMGTNAIPSLLTYMSYEPVVSRYHLVPLCRHLPRWVLGALPPRWFVGNDDRERSANKAVNMFALLGPTAEPAIPELVHMARSRTEGASRPARAMRALATLGPPAIPFFQEQLSSPETASPATWDALEWLGTNAQPLIPLLIKGLQHTNRMIVWYSANTLGNLKLQPELVVPALIDSLRDQRAATRRKAAITLGKFDAFAESALPFLTNCLRDPDSAVRLIAAEAIQNIAPEPLSTSTSDIPPELPASALSQ